MRFVETPVFTVALRRHLDDETYRALQLALILRPAQGQIIQGEEGYASSVGLCLGVGNEVEFALSTIGIRLARHFIWFTCMRRTSRGT